jgi:hypothetical protein
MITRRHRFSHRATEVALVMHALHMTSDDAVLACLRKSIVALAQAMAIKPEGHA